MDSNCGNINFSGDKAFIVCCSAASSVIDHFKEVQLEEGVEWYILGGYLDVQQHWNQKLRIPYGYKLKVFDENMVEIPHFIIYCEDRFMKCIMNGACMDISEEGNIDIIGGIKFKILDGIDE